MKIVVCGLGYVGVTMAACLIKQGHAVVGVDVNPAKAEAFGRGLSPILEPGVQELLAAGHADGRLAGTTAIAGATADAAIIFVCVGTPSRPDGRLDLSQVANATAELGEAIRLRPAEAPPLLCVYRSTMLPGSMEREVVPALAVAAGGEPGSRYEVAYNPEFLRESTAVADYFAPPKIVVGERAPGTSRRLLGIYDGIEAPCAEVPFAVAEMAKYVDNSFHALKVAFANEIGRLAREMEIDPQRVMDIFLSDTKLNISPYYLRPGGAFGGSCLPKDVRALSALMRERDLPSPVIENVLNSNEAHKAYLAGRVMRAAGRGRRILLLGLTFKSDTDDLRESPLVDLAERLLAAGYELAIYDPDLKAEKLLGANLTFVQRHLPRLGALLTADVAEAAATADLVVLGKPMRGVVDRLPPGVVLLNVHRL